jgi:hypothetical protein
MALSPGDCQSAEAARRLLKTRSIKHLSLLHRIAFSQPDTVRAREALSLLRHQLSDQGDLTPDPGVENI